MKFFTLTHALTAIGYTHGTLDTVFVIRTGEKEPVRINAIDFDASTMKRIDEPAPVAPEPAPPTAPVAPPSIDNQILVMKSGTGKAAKFFLTDTKGQKIEGERAEELGIDTEGYATEADAKEALDIINA